MAADKETEIPDSVKKSIKTLIDHFDDEDRAVRDRQIRQWRRLKLLWENVQNMYYSETAHDWRIPDDAKDGDASDQGFYDKPVNVYRAYLESIIAALSVTVPPVICYPDDAENPLDQITAKAGDRIASLIFKHNDAPLLWLHALFVFVTEGMTACYTYSKADKEYGEYTENHYKEETQMQTQQVCPFCGQQVIEPQIMENQEDKFMKGDEDVPLQEPMDQGLEMCANCSRQMIPDLRQSPLTVTKLVGVTNHPKSRVCMEVYGGLFVKVPIWARNQKDCSYLIYSYETHYANVLEQFEDLRGKVIEGQSAYDMYEQWGRTSPQYRGEHPIHNVTVRNCWFRPAAYNILNDEDMEEMKKYYPNGCKAVRVNDEIAHACNEDLDDCWTITYNPLSDYIHFDPIGLLLTSIQDITNDLISLVLQTVEHGIPQTFADPKVLNFNAYRNSEVIPGGIYPATPKSGKALGEGFYEVKTATLSAEVLPFAQKIQEMGQMVSGALPSLFGGQMSGSRTASEYSMSRAQALQRLQSTWKMLLLWWKNVFGKAIPLYIKEMKDDERQVKRDEYGNFINVFVRKAELEGKIGSVELEANENLPITWNQQKDAIMELIQMNNDDLNATITSPENLPYLKKAIGLTDYVVPGEDDRMKQYEEIQLLITSEPITMPPDPVMEQQAIMAGMPPPPPEERPSIEADYDVDNHSLEADICRRWLVGDAGRLCKLENPAGYKNVLLHMKMHKDMDQAKQFEAAQQEMAMMPPPPPPQGGSAKKPPQRNAGVPLGADQNAPTIQ